MPLLLKRCFLIIVLLGGNATIAMADSPRDVSFPTADGGIVDADLYGTGERGVVFAHGAIFNKQSWASLAKQVAGLGYRALAIDFRGYGKSRAGSDPNALYQDVLAAIRWLHGQGVKSVSVIGGSMGGGASARAATQATPGEIDKLILLSPVPIRTPEKLKAKNIYYIASRNESLASAIREQYARAPKPKKLVILEGNGHAQNIFATSQAQLLTDTILGFLRSK